MSVQNISKPIPIQCHFDNASAFFGLTKDNGLHIIKGLALCLNLNTGHMGKKVSN